MMMQMIAWVVSLVFMLAIAGVFVFVALKSQGRQAYPPIQKKWYKARSFYGAALIILILVVSIYTLRDLPYNAPLHGDGQNPTIVDVEAFQFGWDVSETEFKVGDSVEFHVTSDDVNHGFGLYDENMELVAQTQAMPDYTNKTHVTFEEPGTYEILCLEYCGVAHDQMLAEIEVTES